MGAIKTQGDCPNSPYKHLATTMVPLFQPKWLVVLALREWEREGGGTDWEDALFSPPNWNRSSLKKKKEDWKRRSRRMRRGLKLRELLHAPRCVQGGWPGKVKVVPHQSLPYASREMDPAGHFIFLFLISSFERWRRGENEWWRSLKMDGPGVTQEQRGFNVKN